MSIVVDSRLGLDFAVAMGIGLLIGAERERHKAVGLNRSSEGVRTFTIAALLGATCSVFNFWLLVVAILCVTMFSAVSYYR